MSLSSSRLNSRGANFRRWLALCAALPPVLIGGCSGHLGHRLVDLGDPSARFVYVTNEESDTVAMYEVDDATSPTTTEKFTYFGTVPTGHGPRGLAAGSYLKGHDVGRLVVANAGDDSLSVYRIYPSGGLGLSSTVPTGSRPIAVSIPDGEVSTGPVYVLCAGSQQVVEYRFTDDSLAEVGRVATGADPTAMLGGPAEDANGKVTGYEVVVSDGGSKTVSTYTEAPGGGLTPTSPATAVVGNRPSSLAFAPGFLFDLGPSQHDASNGVLFALNSGDSTVSTFKGSGTSYTPLLTSPVGAGVQKIVSKPADDDRSRYTYLYAANDTLHTLDGYSVAKTGALSKISGVSPPLGSGATNELTVIGDQYQLILATSASGGLRTYRKGNTKGVLPFGQTLDTHGDDPNGIGVLNLDVAPPRIVDPTLTFATAAPLATVGVVYEYDLGFTGGRSGPKPTITTVSGALPPGLSLGTFVQSYNDSPGFVPGFSYTIPLQGTPTAAGTYTVTLKATLFEQSVTKTISITVGGGTAGGGPTARFFNLDTRPGHDALSLRVSGSIFPVTAFGAASAAESIVPAGQTSYGLYDAGGAQVEAGDTFLGTTGTRFYLIANVTGFAAGQIPPGEPATDKSEIVVQGGADILTTQNVDVLDGSGASVGHDSYSAAGSVRIQVAPGTYTVRVTNASTGATIATTAAFTVAVNHTELVGTTSDSVGGNPQAFAFAYD